ncbi:MAG TPA: hypothetical protein VEU08_13050 [Vicinamibacterales bacterium]|nr:hypothetical protein [Vicinamibacterales bacterium]
MRAMLDVASKHEDTLVAEGLPPGFLDLVARQISRLERARSERTRALERFTFDTEQTHEALNAARATIEVLEGIVLHSADAPPGVLMVLRQAKRVGPRRAQPEAEVPVVDAVVVEDRLAGPPGLNDRREAAAPEVVRFIRDFLRKKGFALSGGGVRSESIPRTDLQSAETRLRLPA